MNLSTDAPRRKLNKVPILVIEDNADHWLIIRAALKECFAELTPVWVTTQAHALLFLNSCTQDTTRMPRLILLDLYLPRREDGYSLLRSVKTHPIYQSIPVCVLSQSEDQPDMLTCYQLGAASFITKPTTYHRWKSIFYTFRAYWWELATLPPGSV